MNLYFLVEGLTELYIYPMWLEQLFPKLTQIKNACDVDKDNYFIFSGGGIPSILNEIGPAVDEMNEYKKFNYLIIVLDADELSINERKKEVLDVFEEEGINFDLSKVIVIVQNRCMETWFLGNSKFFPTNTETDEFLICKNFYDVSINDPEKMLMDNKVNGVTTIAQYHSYYLKKMFLERKQFYHKGSSNRDYNIVGKGYYLNELLKRASESNQLESFKYFIERISSIKDNILV